MAAGDKIFRIRTVYEVDTSDAEKGVDRVAKRVGSLGSVSSRVGDMLQAIFLDRALTAGAGMLSSAIGVITRGVTELNSQAEMTQTTIGGMLQANGITSSFAAGFQIAGATMAQIRRDSAALPGTAQDFIQVFQTALPAAIAAGMSDPRAIAHFTNNVAGVAIAHGEDAAQSGRDLSMLLSGRAGQEVRLWTEIAPHVRDVAHNMHLSANSAHEFNALTHPQQAQLIAAATARFAPLLAAYGHTWDAIRSTAGSYLQDIERVGTAPLFDRVKNTLEYMNNLYAGHEQQILDIATAVGTTMANGWDRVVGGIYTASRAMDHFIDQHHLVERARAAWGGGNTGNPSFVDRAVGRAGDFVRGLEHDPASQRRAVVMGASAVGAYAGIPGLGIAASALMTFAEHGKEASGTMDSLRAVWTDLMAVVQPIEDLFGSMGNVVGRALVGALPGLMRGVHHITDAIAGVAQSVGAYLMPALDSIGQKLEPVFQHLGTMAEHLGTALGQLATLAGTVIMSLMSAIGSSTTGMDGFVSGLTHCIDALTWAIDKIGTAIQWIVDTLNRLPGINIVLPHRVDTGVDGGVHDEFAESGASSGWGHMGSATTAAALNNLARHVRTPAPNRTNVNVHIEQNIRDARDPNRVIIATRTAIWQAVNTPIQSSTARVSR